MLSGPHYSAIPPSPTLHRLMKSAFRGRAEKRKSLAAQTVKLVEPFHRETMYVESYTTNSAHPAEPPAPSTLGYPHIEDRCSQRRWMRGCARCRIERPGAPPMPILNLLGILQVIEVAWTGTAYDGTPRQLVNPLHFSVLSRAVALSNGVQQQPSHVYPRVGQQKLHLHPQTRQVRLVLAPRKIRVHLVRCLTQDRVRLTLPCRIIFENRCKKFVGSGYRGALEQVPEVIQGSAVTGKVDAGVFSRVDALDTRECRDPTVARSKALICLVS
ncbi:hypothetical protein B0H12DRAFT_1139147 [Mycena haematopus]|nr:hypothetical protein B0H12DRAFT_1139147 [Mycena haematopus]